MNLILTERGAGYGKERVLAIVHEDTPKFEIEERVVFDDWTVYQYTKQQFQFEIVVRHHCSEDVISKGFWVKRMAGLQGTHFLGIQRSGGTELMCGFCNHSVPDNLKFFLFSEMI